MPRRGRRQPLSPATWPLPPYHSSLQRSADFSRRASSTTTFADGASEKSQARLVVRLGHRSFHGVGGGCSRKALREERRSVSGSADVEAQGGGRDRGIVSP